MQIINFMAAPNSLIDSAQQAAIIGGGAATTGLLAGGAYNIYRMQKYNKENPRSAEQMARADAFNLAAERATKEAKEQNKWFVPYTPEEQANAQAFMDEENRRAKDGGAINPLIPAGIAGGLGVAGYGAYKGLRAVRK